MFRNCAELLQFIAEEEIKSVDLKFTDFTGRWRHVTVQPSMISEKFFDTGIGVDGSSLPGFEKVDTSDLVLLPQPETAFIDPFWETPVISLICNIVGAGNRESYAYDPRWVAHKAEEHLIETGIADLSKWSPEFEFYLLTDVTVQSKANMALYMVSSDEVALGSEEEIEGPFFYTENQTSGYDITPPRDKSFEFRLELVNLLEETGVKVNYHHHETGTAGHCEVEVRPDNLMRVTDLVQRIKYFTKNLARRHGKVATFMPKPLHNMPGNGLHFHQHLFLNGEPLFYAEKGYGGLSELALSYVAGLLKHSRSLLAFTNPSTNSYRRLVPGYEAPVKICYSSANRSSTIRIPAYATEPLEKRIEYRPPDATCNPYFAVSAMLLAGLDGIKRKLDPAKEGFRPIEGEAYGPESEGLGSLPATLEEALEALKEDHDYLLEGDVFTEDLLETWVKYKFENEVTAVRERPHPYEMVLYLDV